jgi:hypothetical protein
VESIPGERVLLRISVTFMIDETLHAIVETRFYTVYKKPFFQSRDAQSRYGDKFAGVSK